MKNKEEMPDDLLGDIVPEINPEKLFDEKEYATLIIGSEGMSKKDTNNADLLTLLVSSRSTREEKDAALIQLKENKAQDFIMSAIIKTKKLDHKALLISACWETGLDFSKHFLTIIDLIGHENFAVSLEAFTVIQEMETEIEPALLKKALTTLNKVKEPSLSVSDAIELINQRLNA
jgi:hypothetical protein